jgi:hypothetical protein
MTSSKRPETTKSYFGVELNRSVAKTVSENIKE